MKKPPIVRRVPTTKLASFNEIPMFLMFSFYTFILIDYLWKTKEMKDKWPEK